MSLYLEFLIRKLYFKIRYKCPRTDCYNCKAKEVCFIDYPDKYRIKYVILKHLFYDGLPKDTKQRFRRLFLREIVK